MYGALIGTPGTSTTDRPHVPASTTVTATAYRLNATMPVINLLHPANSKDIRVRLFYDFIRGCDVFSHSWVRQASKGVANTVEFNTIKPMAKVELLTTMFNSTP
ncbi:hypothetical protein C8R44DRAFT_752575 [Mycena epipterygia]|nr:hypothetical protein C8R44DRAFT_752575 [Mycena epipterygia]